MSETVKWLGYEFIVYDPQNTNWNEVGGLYVFAGLVKDDQGMTVWRAYYIGETGDFASRLPTHENWSEAVLLGATHIHARVASQAKDREEIEQALIQAYEPVLNEQTN